MKYDNCKDCVSKCEHAGKDREFICGNGVSCKVTKKPIVTNADKIRAMSDEELAEWLCQALDCDFCKAHMQNIPTHSCCENHESGILKWLQQPAEEEP